MIDALTPLQARRANSLFMENLMPIDRARPGRRFLFCLLLLAALAPMTVPGAAYGSLQGSLTISPASGTLGTTFHVHGTGFVNFSLVTHQLDLSVSDASPAIMDGGSVAADADGNIDAEIDTSDGKYTTGTYSVLASYTYWGTRRDALQNVICTPCPVSTVPLAELATFTIE